MSSQSCIAVNAASSWCLICATQHTEPHVRRSLISYTSHICISVLSVIRSWQKPTRSLGTLTASASMISRGATLSSQSIVDAAAVMHYCNRQTCNGRDYVSQNRASHVTACIRGTWHTDQLCKQGGDARYQPALYSIRSLTCTVCRLQQMCRQIDSGRVTKQNHMSRAHQQQQAPALHQRDHAHRSHAP